MFSKSLLLNDINNRDLDQALNEGSGYDDSAFSDKIEAQNILLIFIYG